MSREMLATIKKTGMTRKNFVWCLVVMTYRSLFPENKFTVMIDKMHVNVFDETKGSYHYIGKKIIERAIENDTLTALLAR